MPSLTVLVFAVLAFGAAVNLWRIVDALRQITHSLIQIARDVEMMRVADEDRGRRERAEHESLLATDPRTFPAPDRKRRA